jgi:DNA polymerase-3 subunit epsilon
LKDHHRALCDARAAAHLLNLINEKRGNEPKESEIAA